MRAQKITFIAASLCFHTDFPIHLNNMTLAILTRTGLELQILRGTQFQGHSRRAPKATVLKNTIEV